MRKNYNFSNSVKNPYAETLEAEEELECIRAYDSAKASHDEAIPLAQAVEEIEDSEK